MNFFTRQHFFGRKPKEVAVKRRVDKEKIERIDRESRIVSEAEPTARDAKSASLRELRLRTLATAGHCFARR